MTTRAVTVADLRPVDLFDDLSDEELAEWLPFAKFVEAPAGEVMDEQGTEPRGVWLLLEGVVLALLVEGDRTEPVGRNLAPTWMFAIPVLIGGGAGVRMQTETACRLALIEREDFQRLAFAQPAVFKRVMRQVAPLMARMTALEQSRERLASLGTMAAGLAHELNNPAAAARRAAAQIAEAVDLISSSMHRFVDSGLEREQAGRLLELRDELVERAAARTALDALDAADAEDEMVARLEEIGVAEAWKIAEPLAAAGVDQAWIDRVAELAGPATDAAMGWVAATLTAHRLAAELLESTERMSNLVSAVKTYAYMDRGELVEVDLHEGIETTLTVLGHRLKHTSIDVERRYDRSLPKLTVRGSELNQVWTNLLDNAIDALGERGTITIATACDGSCALVDVSDDGPGVSPELRERVFDSFVTSKEVGRGTGLGLATAWRIVVDRHGGTLGFDSEPGRTTFHVRLPLKQP